MAGISRGSIQMYFTEFIWRKQKTKHRLFKHRAFNELLNTIRRKCPINELDDDDAADFRFQEDDEICKIIEEHSILDSDFDNDSDASIDVEEPVVKSNDK